MSKSELYQDYDRSIMIQDSNAFVQGLIAIPNQSNPNQLIFEIVSICLN